MVWYGEVWYGEGREAWYGMVKVGMQYGVV
jgi:hypothetical protein